MKKLYDIKWGQTKFEEQSFSNILSLLSSGAAPFQSFVSERGKGDWEPLLLFNDFGKKITNKLMLASNGYSYESIFNHWYIKDGDRSYGPFSLIQMLEFYNQHRIYKDNLVRHSTFEKWEKFIKSGPFNQASLDLLLACPEINEVITRRRHPRISYTNEAFMSSRAELYRGVTWSLSCQGLGLVTDGSTELEKEDRVNIIVNANNEHGAVQVKGRVVNVKKEVNYERLAIEFDEENSFLNQYIQQRIPKL